MSAVLKVTEDWESPWWRLSTLYTIVDDDAVEMAFRPFAQQRYLYDNMWFWNLILKGRQQGFTTFIDLMALDQCLFNKNFSAGIIAHSLEDAEKIFRTKVRFPLMKLPRSLRNHVGIERESASAVQFSNGSSITVDTSARSSTLQFLHVSEFGKICAKNPEKAREIVTGSFPALKTGQMLFVESTAEGREGKFFEYCTEALKAKQEGRKETKLDFRLHFFAWWQKPSNVLDPEGVRISPEMNHYFDLLSNQRNIRLTLEQKCWYVKTAETLREDMKREQPSYPEEAFEHAILGAIFGEEMTWLRKNNRIGAFPYDPAYPVNTFWDLGVDDSTTIWFHQRIRNRNRLIGYYEASMEGLAHYVNHIRERGFAYEAHYLPHDVDETYQNENPETRRQILGKLQLKNIVSVPRVKHLQDGIETTRVFLKTCEIDADACIQGIKALDHYQRTRDDKHNRWSTTPLHNWASHGADGLRTGAQGYKPPGEDAGTFVRHRSNPRGT